MNKSTNYWSPRNRNHLNSTSSNCFIISCNPVTSTTLYHRWNQSSVSNLKSNWSPVILKIWVLRLLSSKNRCLYNKNTRPNKGWIPITRNRQPSSSSYKLRNSSTGNSSWCYSFMGYPSPWSKSRRNSWTTKPNWFHSPYTWCLLRSVFRNLWSKSHIYTN